MGLKVGFFIMLAATAAIHLFVFPASFFFQRGKLAKFVMRAREYVCICTPTYINSFSNLLVRILCV